MPSILLLMEIRWGLYRAGVVDWGRAESAVGRVDNHMVLHKVLVTVDAWRGAAPRSAALLPLDILQDASVTLRRMLRRFDQRRAPQCSQAVRPLQTPYCGRACQEQHWKEGGQTKSARRLKKVAATSSITPIRNTEAVAVAGRGNVRTIRRGQTCYICSRLKHPVRTREGLVRGCACGERDGVSIRGDSASCTCRACWSRRRILVEEGRTAVWTTRRWM